MGKRDGFEYEVLEDGMWLFWMNQVQMVQCCRKVTSEKKIAGAIRSIVNFCDLQVEY